MIQNILRVPSTYHPPIDEVGTYDTGTEKSKKIRRTEEGNHNTKIIKTKIKNTGKRQQEEKKKNGKQDVLLREVRWRWWYLDTANRNL